MSRRMDKRAARARKTDGANVHGRSRYNRHTGRSYKPGDHWVECQRCGLDVRESNTLREWNGNIVCAGCMDPRQPQDFVRAVRDDIAAKGNVRPASAYDTDFGSGSTSVPGGTFVPVVEDESTGTSPEDFTYIECSGDPKANANNLQVWYDTNDLTTQYDANDWTGDLLTGAPTDVCRSILNKAYPLASFPTRGTVATCDAREEGSTTPAPLVEHDAIPTDVDFTGTATYAWGGYDLHTSAAVQMRSNPRQTSQELLQPCDEQSTRVWVFETPASNDADNQIQVTAHGTSGWARIYYDGTSTMQFWDFEAGDRNTTLDMWEIQQALPKWTILMARCDELTEEINFWRNGTHVLEYIVSEHEGTRTAFNSSWWCGSRFPTPFQGEFWRPKLLGEFLTYDRWLTFDEMNELLLHLSLKHGVNIEGTIQ